MIYFFKTTTLFTICAAMIACNSSNKSIQVATPDSHTSESPLDWAGIYSGVIPCADCEGIETELTINSDLTYTLISTYLGKEPMISDTIKGTFSWENGNIIHLSNGHPFKFKVEEDQVRILDSAHNPVKGELAQFYALSKNGNPEVEDIKWHLVELNGKKVEGDAETHYLIFNSKERRAVTKVGCNVMNYQYRITYMFRLELSKGLSTLMACPDSIEDEYRQVLEMLDNLSVSENRLTLNKARMAPLAVFEPLK